MSTYDFDVSEAAVHRTREERAVAETPLSGLREHRLDVLGTRGLLGLQRAAGNGAVSRLADEETSPVLDVVSGGGSALDSGVRTEMERRLGADFSDVRVHTDAAAHDSARSVGAHAYTVGSHVVFQRDAYDPGSTAGRTTLAHELTHVIQQRSGPVDGTPTGNGVSVSDPRDRFEQAAAANAERAVAQPEAESVQRSVDAPVAQGAENPDEEPEENAVQGQFVQREEEAEEEEAAG